MPVNQFLQCTMWLNTIGKKMKSNVLILIKAIRLDFQPEEDLIQETVDRYVEDFATGT